MKCRTKATAIKASNPISLGLLAASILLLAGCAKSPEQLLDDARQQMAANEYPAASISLRNLLQDEPENLQGRLLLAEVSIALNDGFSAEKELTWVRDLGAPAEDYMLLQLETLLRQQRNTEVLDILSRDLADLGISETESLVARGRALLGLGSSLEAETAFREALDLDADNELAAWGLAAAQAERGEKAAALATLDSLLDSNPDAPWAWLLKGQIALREGRIEDADRDLTAGMQTLAGKTDWFLEAQILHGLIDSKLYLDDVAEADELHSRLRTIAPGNPITEFLAAKISADKGDYDRAANQLESILDRMPGNVTVMMLYGSVSLAKQDYAQAESVFGQVVSRYPDNMAARRLLASAQSRSGDSLAAVETLGPILDRGIRNDAALSILAGRSLVQAGSAERAVELLEAALAENPGDSQVMLNLASTYLAVERPEDAIELAQAIPDIEGDYQKDLILALGYAALNQSEAADQQIASIIENSAEDVRVLALAGEFYFNTSGAAQALEYFERAVAVDSNHLPSRLGLARAQFKLGDLSSAESNYRTVLATDESSMGALIGLADLRAVSGDIAESIELLERAVSLYDSAPIPRTMLAQALVREGDPARAEQLAREASRLAPEDGRLQAEVGGVLLELGKHIEAISFLRKGVELAPGSSPAWYLLAEAQLAIGELADARVSLNRAIELNPSSLSANLLMAMLEMREGDLDRALELALSTKANHPDNPGPMAVEADVYMAMGRLDEATAAYQSVYDLAPSGPRAMRVFQAARLSGSEDPAATLQQWVADHPDDWGALNMLGMHYDQTGETNKAISTYEQAIASNDENYVAMNNLALRYSDAGDERALSVAEQAYALQPERPVIADTLGWLRAKNGDLAGALPILEDAASKAPNSGDIQYHLAYTRKELGDATTSKQILQRILESGVPFSERDNAVSLLNEIEAGD